MKVDKKKLEFLLKEDPLYIEKALPYAIVFWVESEFIKNITPEMIKDWERFEWEFDDFEDTINYINAYHVTNFRPVTWIPSSYSWHSSSYSSSSGFSSGSSFGWWFSSGWGGGGGWWGWW